MERLLVQILDPDCALPASRVQESLRRTCGVGRRESEGGVMVNLGHTAGLNFPVLRAILNYTKGVDPEVLHAEATGEMDCVLEVEGEGAKGYGDLVGFEVGVGGCGDGNSAPAVAEGQVHTTLAVSFQEAEMGAGRAPWAAHVDNAGGEGDHLAPERCEGVAMLYYSTGSVAPHACSQPVLDGGDVVCFVDWPGNNQFLEFCLGICSIKFV